MFLSGQEKKTPKRCRISWGSVRNRRPQGAQTTLDIKNEAGTSCCPVQGTLQNLKNQHPGVKTDSRSK